MTTVQKTISKRLHVTETKIRKIIVMVSNGEYCIDIIKQVSQARRSIKKTEELFLESHVVVCLSHIIHRQGRKEALVELGQIYKKAI